MLAVIVSFFCFLPPQDTVPLDTVPANRLLTINRVLIIGNKITRNSIISRELSLKPGDTISSERIERVLVQDKNKIYNLRLFNTVMVRWIDLGTREADILVDVSERWYTFPVPVFDIADRNFNEWIQNFGGDFSRVNYGLRLYQYNFRGRNETVRFTAQFGFVRRFELSYRLPYIDRQQKHGLIFDFEYVEPKNIAYATQDHKLVFLRAAETLRTSVGAGITYTFRKSFYQTHLLSAQFRNSHISDTVASLNPNFYGNGRQQQRFGSLTYSFNADHRDVIAYPLNGYQVTATVEKVGLGLGDDVDQWSMTATYAHHKEVAKGWYFSNFTSLYRMFPERQPYAQFFGLGYKRQFVRGYEVYVVEGPFYALNKTTLKKRIFARQWNMEGMRIEQFRHLPISIYAKIYADMGYVENNPDYREQNVNTRLSNRWLGGLGAGLDIVTFYDFVTRFEYSLTREGTAGFFFHVRKEF
ncbi:MAG: hypothetical protein MUC38_08485 [Cyclobacteriaceae bacterium]|jgi:outer membrane protein assembly factor BamA|nr:hypothetical protein [Cyclobacteriaceae bacterium]